MHPIVCNLVCFCYSKQIFFKNFFYFFNMKAQPIPLNNDHIKSSEPLPGGAWEAPPGRAAFNVIN